jgi:MYXO-CTERM domain-containing protein
MNSQKLKFKKPQLASMLVNMTRIVLFALLCLTSGAASALSISSSQATENIINFDFTGQTPAPPYNYVKFVIDQMAGPGGSKLHVDFFDQLNGLNFVSTASADFSYYPSSIDFVTSYGFDAPASFQDGVFSVGIYSEGGGLTYNGASSYAINFDQNGIIISEAQVTGAPVPEPDSYAMALMGLGLLGFISRRRKAADKSI